MTISFETILLGKFANLKHPSASVYPHCRGDMGVPKYLIGFDNPKTFRFRKCNGCSFAIVKDSSGNPVVQIPIADGTCVYKEGEPTAAHIIRL